MKFFKLILKKKCKMSFKDEMDFNSFPLVDYNFIWIKITLIYSILTCQISNLRKTKLIKL